MPHGISVLECPSTITPGDSTRPVNTILYLEDGLEKTVESALHIHCAGLPRDRALRIGVLVALRLILYNFHFGTKWWS